MLARIVGRLVTGPIAFLIAGAVDVTVFGLRALARRNKPPR